MYNGLRVKKDLSWKNPKKEFIKMLSWNNPEEVQKKGLELAAGIKYLGNFFQPFIDEESKSLWNNCALILSDKTDEELKHWLLQCFKRFQDMDCPGSEIIAERLRKYSDTESLEHERKEAVGIARILDDKEWL